MATEQHSPNEVIIKLKDGNSLQDTDDLLEELGATVADTTQQLGIDLWTISGLTVEEAVQNYEDDPRIEYIEPNYMERFLTAPIYPNDPGFGNLWGLHNTGQTGGTPDADINAPEAWGYQVEGGIPPHPTGALAVVGVLDTGIDYNHPDLNDNIWINPGESGGGRETNGIDDDGNGYIDDFRGWDFYSNDNNPMDGHSHGTHVSGTIGAEGNNGIGVVGVNWDVQIMPLKIFSDAGAYAGDFQVIKAIEYAKLNGADLTNNSWGGGGYSQSLSDAIAAGPLFVAAAGNNGRNNNLTPFYPSSYNLNNIIAVAATDHNDRLSSFSNYGSFSVDLGAPGTSIYSTVPGGNYGYKTGTSMATPHVAGAAALMIGTRRARGLPNQSVSYWREKILNSVERINSLVGRTVTGGRLNLHSAINQRGVGWGDVHLITFDGKSYDLQSSGEFILARTARMDDDWQVQTRQEPWPANTNTSVNTAFATLVDGHRVVLDLDFSHKLEIDGVPNPLGDGQILPIGNSRIERRGDFYTITYAGADGIIDQDDAQVIGRVDNGGGYIDIAIDSSGGFEGLLGNNDGNPNNEFTLRDGTVLENPSSQEIHEVFGENWQINSEESLFNTAPIAHSNPTRYLTLEDLDPQARRAALKLAGDVGFEGEILNAVAFDLAATHDMRFLEGAAATFGLEVPPNIPDDFNDFLEKLTFEDPGIKITGTDGPDRLMGTSANETFIGSLSRDIITGGGGNDTFVYSSIQQRGDLVTDFSLGDIIDLSQVLDSIGYMGGAPIDEGYIRFLGQGSTITRVQIDSDGIGPVKASDFIIVQGVDVTIMNNANNFIF